MSRAWHKLPNYNASIRWAEDGNALVNEGEVLLPNGSITTVQRVSEPSHTGNHHYLHRSNGQTSRFETFEALMKGLGFTRETPA
jgi:hypothetical protein